MESVGKCSICNEVYTQSYAELSTGLVVYVCRACMDKAIDNFIWLCMSCGKAYIRPKDLVITRIKDHELKRAYMLCEDMQMIQGIDMCIACDPERIVDYMEMAHSGIEC